MAPFAQRARKTLLITRPAPVTNLGSPPARHPPIDNIQRLARVFNRVPGDLLAIGSFIVSQPTPVEIVHIGNGIPRVHGSEAYCVTHPALVHHRRFSDGANRARPSI